MQNNREKPQSAQYPPPDPARGQGLVEFALIFPILLLIVYGTIEFGRLLFFYTAVNTSSREAARYGSAVGTSGGGVPNYRDCTGIMQAALQSGGYAGLESTDIVIQYDNGPGTSSFSSCSSTVAVDLGDRIVVQASTNFQPLVPLANIPPIPIQSSAARTIIKGVSLEGTPPNTPTLGPPTATRTPTPTQTNTPTTTPIDTPTPTLTSTIAPSGTANPTETVVATSTSGPPATPTPSCSNLDASAMIINNQEYGIVLFNWDSFNPVNISSLYTEWPNGTLEDIYLGGSNIWSGNHAPPNATISSFSGDTSLPYGAKLLQFDLSVVLNDSDDIAITVNFDIGCSLHRDN